MIPEIVYVYDFLGFACFSSLFSNISTWSTTWFAKQSSGLNDDNTVNNNNSKARVVRSKSKMMTSKNIRTTEKLLNYDYYA